MSASPGAHQSHRNGRSLGVVFFLYEPNSRQVCTKFLGDGTNSIQVAYQYGFSQTRSPGVRCRLEG
ncbi:hypothetical protein MASR2M48_21450 [Spirochaetota bacterium]